MMAAKCWASTPWILMATSSPLITADPTARLDVPSCRALLFLLLFLLNHKIQNFVAMPTFTPINAQEVAEAQPGDVGDKAAVGVPHAHCRAAGPGLHWRATVTALRLWNKGPIAEALAKLEELSTSPLISMQQDSHIETECDAYCNEYGGITMSRLRSLVFRGIGSLVIQTASRAKHGLVFQNVGTPRFEITDYELEPELAEAAHKAVASITTAIRFSQAETTTYLLLAHSAILAGCLDIATSALSSGLQASSGPVMLPELQARGLVCSMDVAGALVRQLHSPAQWWCLKTLCQVALLKGDSDMVEAYSGAVSGRWRRRRQYSSMC
ncbi:hypothetical protein DL89DRAFT_84325 [Linderina pennispora]|uniref:Uncharacterized protein n=1 Tax=Linderina pennispora TaxID=61395 RepID=A0A1Y1WHA2_9FUNG|nr:uncharacterized protein DL89DRAFT_84325 [Linderina pennispora]ORX72899.1 hypothetical protein DL89DRAFT_84325 [Linderina pennispora]